MSGEDNGKAPVQAIDDLPESPSDIARRRMINSELITICELSEEQGRAVVSAVALGEISYMTINY